MTRADKGLRFAPSPQGIAMIRERMRRMGLPVTEAAARSLVEALFEFEGPRLYALAQGNLENSLEIIRDTAESALSSLKTERATAPVPAVVEPRRPPTPRRAPALPEGLSDEERRPVFKRPRR
jgi:hypothetical protein